MSKIITGILIIMAAIIAIAVLAGKSGKAGVAGIADSFGGIFSSNLPTDTAEIAANPAVVNDPLNFHDPTTDVQKATAIPAGTYLIAGTQKAPLAFSVVGGEDNTPKTQTLFGSQSGEGGITAGAGVAGASGSREGGTGSWSSAGYTTRY